MYNKTFNEVLEQLGSNLKTGLNNEEVANSLEKYGRNELVEKPPVPIWKKFLAQFNDIMIIILILAAIISIIVDPHEWVDSLIIMLIVIINAVIGVAQESKAEKSLEALKKMSAPSAKVLRNGDKLSIAASDLVVGDIVFLDAGDFVPADLRLTEAFNLQIDESALTGESVPVDKISTVIEGDDVPLGDRKNLAYSSTIVTYGRGVGVVINIGMNTEVGKIAKMLSQEKDELTPLQVTLAQIGKVIGVICIVICIVVFFMETLTGLSWIDSFKTAIALAVAAIPEGLPAFVTVVLALGVQKMVKVHAIVRKLPAVETLGSASIICSDKTGTLTQNKMTVVKAYNIKDGLVDVPESVSDEIHALSRAFALCSDATIVGDKEIGDPTETALIALIMKYGITKEELEKNAVRINELAFDSDRKMMSVLLKTQDKYISITKGALDSILPVCLNVKDKEAIMQANNDMANGALRVLAVSYKEYSQLPKDYTFETAEVDLQFLGLVGMIDPPRVEVKDAIALAKKAGVRTIMITGDHITTASAIAKDLGILNEGELAISGTALSDMSDEELIANIEKYSVYARVAPEHKVRIVNAWQSKGKVVAMTGDGVNDSPALKTADIGCAMGITGTDVAKSAASMILTDDNFATIVTSIREGRGIYNNIRKVVQFLLSSNIGEVLTIFGASLITFFGGIELGVPLLPIHLLWINLITDSLPAFALGMEATDPNVMNEKPRPKNENFFANGLGLRIAYQGAYVGVITLASYMYGNAYSHEMGMTMAFITLALSQLFHAFNVKSEHSVFSKQVFNNKYLIGSFIIGLFLQLVIIYTPLSSVFKMVPMDPIHLLVAVGLAFSIIIFVEITKLFTRKK
ncbi:MAG: calcium-translocating P-type ATPase, PMCA-type [Erysipelotrichaceae bacterium]